MKRELRDDEWSDGDYVQAIRDKWQEIGSDMLRCLASETGEESIDGVTAREIVADYLEMPGWWDLPFEERDDLLAEALPEESWCL